MKRMTVEYRIDADDRLEIIGSGWARFAIENGASDLTVIPPEQDLWRFISGTELTNLWRLLVSRARTGGQPIMVAFRCDGPDVRRLFTMRMIPGPDEALRFLSTLVRAEPRPTVAALDVRTGRDVTAPLMCVCGWCNRCRDGATWVAVERYVRDHGLLERTRQPGITHGICEECAARVRRGDP